MAQIKTLKMAQIKSLNKNIYNNYNKKNIKKNIFKNLLNIKLILLMIKIIHKKPYMQTALRALKAIYQWPTQLRCVIMKKIYYFIQ